MISLKKLIDERYVHPNWGMVSNRSHVIPLPDVIVPANCDNYPLFTAFASLFLRPEDRQKLVENACKFFSDCQLQNLQHGYLYPSREPLNPGNISQDNLIGYAALDSNLAYLVYELGQDLNWCFPFEDKSLKGRLRFWLGRHLDMVPFIKMQAGLPTSYTEQVIWALFQMFSFLKPYADTSGKHLAYVMVKKMKPLISQYPMTKFGIYYFETLMKQQYEAGAADMLFIYYGRSHWINELEDSAF